MKIDQWQLTQLHPCEHNPRLNDEAVDVVAASIREFGFRQPIVVDGDGVKFIERKAECISGENKGVRGIKGVRNRIHQFQWIRFLLPFVMLMTTVN